MFREIESFLSLWDRFKLWWKEKRSPPVDSIAARFVKLFESHGIYRNQIPRFIGHDLTLADVQSDESLVIKLTDELLDDVCKMFAIQREWLDGADKEIYPIHHFYKHHEDFSCFIDDLKQSDSRLSGVLIVPQSANSQSQAVINLVETIGYIGDKPIDRYHLCVFDSYSYWKSRAYMTACIAIAFKKDVYINGITLPNKIINKLSTGENLLNELAETKRESDKKSWYAEDIVNEPEKYLKGVDPESDKFGIKAALSMWLDLEEQGFMNTGINKNFRDKFVTELKKY